LVIAALGAGRFSLDAVIDRAIVSERAGSKVSGGAP